VLDGRVRRLERSDVRLGRRELEERKALCWNGRQGRVRPRVMCRLEEGKDCKATDQLFSCQTLAL
jgi:hypothetical protein